MATKKNIKVRDLKPSKDAKGGGTKINHGPAVNSTKTSGASASGTKVSHHGHHAVN
jgi:hypothetical protein